MTAAVQLDARMVEGVVKACLARRFDAPKPIPDCHREMWSLACSDYAQVAFAAPRGHAKSTALTFAYGLSELLFRRSQHLLLLSANESLANDHLNDMRIELQENELLNQWFGNIDFLKERENEIVCQFGDKHRFRVITKGAGQRMRGLKWERKRPDLVLADDLEDDEIVLNEDRRDKFRRWFYGAVRPIVRAGGRLRLYGTIMHLDSLLENTMPNRKDPGFRESPLKQWSETPNRPWRAVKYRAHDADFSHILWPEQYDRAYFERLRAEFAEMGLSDVYGQEYLNDPIDQATAYFRREDLLAMSAEDAETRKEYYVGADFAISEQKRAARTAFVVGGVDAYRELHIVDVRKGRWDTLEIIDEIFAIHDRWHEPYFRFESENIEKTLRPVLEAEMRKRQKFIRFDTKVPTKDKIQRARQFQYRTRAGNVRFDKQASWWPDLEDELVHFPKWKSKDQVDALAWLGDLVADEIAALSDKELDEEHYRGIVREEAWQMGGRSFITGY